MPADHRTAARLARARHHDRRRAHDRPQREEPGEAPLHVQDHAEHEQPRQSGPSEHGAHPRTQAQVRQGHHEQRTGSELPQPRAGVEVRHLLGVRGAHDRIHERHGEHRPEHDPDDPVRDSPRRRTTTWHTPSNAIHSANAWPCTDSTRSAAEDSASRCGRSSRRHPPPGASSAYTSGRPTSAPTRSAMPSPVHRPRHDQHTDEGHGCRGRGGETPQQVPHRPHG